MNMAHVLLSSLLALLASTALGQQPVADGMSYPVNARGPVDLAAPNIPALQIELPPTVEPVQREETECDEVGYIRPASVNVGAALGAAVWHDLPDGGQAARIELRSPDATGLRVELTNIGDLELRVYAPDSLAAFGPYTHPRLTEDGTWWSTVIFGESLGLEFRRRPATALPKPLPEIRSIVYLYTPFSSLGGGPPPGTCDPDISCYPMWVNSVEDLAVGYMLFNCGSDGCGACTGALLNRNPSDPSGYVSPTFMTARHCIGDQAAADTLNVIWDFKTATCDGTAPDPNTLPRNTGSLLLKTTILSEWTLLGLYDADLSGNYLGWDSAYLGNFSPTTGVHHGANQPKRICFGMKQSEETCLGALFEYGVQYTTGRTIPGASGSPLFDASRRVRGTLSCDNRDCPPDAYSEYGRFDTAFPILRWHLYQMANPTYVNGAVAGDPGNDGDSERGTQANPFNTVYEATFCVPTGGDVMIAPRSYNEQFTLWRPMTLKRSGSSGVVTIGQ